MFYYKNNLLKFPERFSWILTDDEDNSQYVEENVKNAITNDINNILE